MENKSKKIIIAAIIIIVIVLGVIFWYWQKEKLSFSNEPVNQKTLDISLGSQILQKIQNPAQDKLPETNPFQTETNPLKVNYKNPFK